MKRVSIHNFQSHKDSTLELSPTVNALEGTSDSGKSAVLRAILWALTNRPDGTAFASYWAKDKNGKVSGEVSVAIDNLTRVRSADFNGYLYASSDGVSRFEALKGAVPAAIADAIDIGEVNIQRQMDPPFLLSSTPGEAARYVNSLVGLDEIDAYQKALKGMARDNSRALQDETARLSAVEKDLAAYDWVDAANEKIQQLGQATATTALLEVKARQLSLLDDLDDVAIDALRLKLMQADENISHYPDMPPLQAKLLSLSRLDDAIALAGALGSAKRKVGAAEPLVAALSGNATSALANKVFSLDKGVSAVEECNSVLNSKTAIIARANALIGAGKQTCDEVSRLISVIRKLDGVESDTHAIRMQAQALAQVSAELKDKACPVCGAALQ